MDYMQEDMDAMKNELQMWRQENRQHAEALQKEQRNAGPPQHALGNPAHLNGSATEPHQGNMDREASTLHADLM
ncbi:hypothetical protein Q9966_008448 [Columba livia]|nr:hypothetical protein Q9966_008448 [Columba livia]